MDARDPKADAFLGVGWSFPPRFVRGSSLATSGVEMRAARADIEESLRILFTTAAGERYFEPAYGLDLRARQFDSLDTTDRSDLEDRCRVAIALYEPRIDVVALSVVAPQHDGTLVLSLEYRIRATNSRFNLVIPFNELDANELQFPRAAALAGRG